MKNKSCFVLHNKVRQQLVDRVLLTLFLPFSWPWQNRLWHTKPGKQISSGGTIIFESTKPCPWVAEGFKSSLGYLSGCEATRDVHKEGLDKWLFFAKFTQPYIPISILIESKMPWYRPRSRASASFALSTLIFWSHSSTISSIPTLYFMLASLSFVRSDSWRLFRSADDRDRESVASLA